MIVCCACATVAFLLIFARLTRTHPHTRAHFAPTSGAFTREQMREQTQPENEAAPADASAGGATGSYDPASYASAAAGAYAAGGGGMPNFVHVGGGHGGPGNPWTSSSLSLAQRLAAPAAFVGRAPPSFQNVAVAGGSAAEPSMARSPSAVILVPGGGAGDQAQAKAGVRPRPSLANSLCYSTNPYAAHTLHSAPFPTHMRTHPSSPLFSLTTMTRMRATRQQRL